MYVSPLDVSVCINPSIWNNQCELVLFVIEQCLVTCNVILLRLSINRTLRGVNG